MGAGRGSTVRAEERDDRLLPTKTWEWVWERGALGLPWGSVFRLLLSCLRKPQGPEEELGPSFLYPWIKGKVPKPWLPSLCSLINLTPEIPPS